jgi:hypothetical protein
VHPNEESADVIVRSTIKIQGVVGECEVPVTYRDNEAVLTTLPCTEKGHRGPATVQVTVPRVEAAALQHGALPKRALTSIDEDTRERFISGVCPRCWDRLFRR